MGTGGLLGLVFSAFRPFHKDNSYPIAFFIKHLINPSFGLKVITSGRKKALAARPCVFISNHQNNFDILIAANMVPPGVVSLGKKQMLFFPIFGWYYWLAGHILIDRSNRKKAFESMEKVRKAIQEKDTSVWIMPEGTRSKGRGILPFKKGAFHTAVQAQCPITIIAISTYEKGIDLERLRGNKYLVKVLDPIPTKGLGRDDVHDLMKKCERLMRDEVAKLDELLIASNS